MPKVPLTRKNISYLREKIDEVGGLPILVSNRDTPSTAMRVDTFDGFLSLVDYAQALSNRLSIQPYVDVKHYGRLVVLGDQIISSPSTCPLKPTPTPTATSIWWWPGTMARRFPRWPSTPPKATAWPAPPSIF